MVIECTKCNRNFESQEALHHHEKAKHSTIEKPKKSLRPYLIGGIILLIAFFSISSVNSYMKKPGQYDSFTQCLSEKGAVMYGNDFCSYTVQQLNFFGKSKKHVNYIKCSENEEECDEKNIRVTPTWEFEGEIYPQVQNFERLSAVTGCKI